jgi:hypothetical protein
MTQHAYPAAHVTPPPTAHGGWGRSMLSRASPLKRLTSGLNRDYRMSIGLSTSDFHIHVQTPETNPSSSTAQSVPNHARRFLDIFASHSVYQNLPSITISDSLSQRPMSPPAMHETRRLVEAASALSALLHTRGVPHAFYGDVLVSLLANQPLAAVRSFVEERRTFLTVCPPANFMHRSRRNTPSVPHRSGYPPFGG